MSYENPRQAVRFRGQVMFSRFMAVGLSGMALLLMGCSSGQATADEASQGTQAEQAPSAETAIEAPEVKADWMSLAQILPVAAQVELGEEVIDLEVTRSQEEQATGLMYRESLADDRGMLFSFEPARPVQFWMKNVVIDLDMVFVHEGKVVGIAQDVPPCESTPCETYGPGFGVLVDQVIELRGGRAAELGLAVGDDVVVKPLSGRETP